MSDSKVPPSKRPSVAPDPRLPEDEKWMDLALLHAKSGRPSPNPHVGATVVKDGELIATGHHEKAGTDHGEVAALRNAGPRAAGATLYSTLEPCNHHGRMPPCTDAIIAAGIARVVVGTRDPNPHVDGGGVEALRAAGIEVTTGVREPVARALIAPWAKHVTTGMPYVSLKLAVSLDGRIATRSGASKWITGPDARAKVHLLRSRCDAVAVGIGTAAADDPRLTVRDAPGESPRRVVFDTNLRLSVDSRLAQTAREIPTIVLCGPDAPESAEEVLTELGVECVRVQLSTIVLCGPDAPESAEEVLTELGVECVRVQLSTEGRIDVVSALELLAQRGVVSMLVEGGAELAGSFLAGRLADDLHAFIAPILLGPRGRPGAVDWAGPDTPQQAPRIASPAWELVGTDAYVHGPIIYPE